MHMSKPTGPFVRLCWLSESRLQLKGVCKSRRAGLKPGQLVKMEGKSSRRGRTGHFTGRNRGFTTSAAFALLRTQMDVAAEGLAGVGEPRERNRTHFQTQ